MIDEIVADWAEGRVKYDIRHWMANWAAMVSADKSSYLFRVFMSYTSDAIYKMLTGEADRVRSHMAGLRMDAAHIGRVGRRYWRRRARYACPDPATIVRGLYDVFLFFREMEDPERPGHRFFTSDADHIFLKEIAYVQQGYLSDPPGLNMYVRVGMSMRTGFIYFRSLRSTCVPLRPHPQPRTTDRASVLRSGAPSRRTTSTSGRRSTRAREGARARGWRWCGRTSLTLRGTSGRRWMPTR